MSTIQTPRLRLRPWRDEDKPLFAQLNADAQVMRYFPSTLTKAQSDSSVERFSKQIDELGYGFWAAERKDSGQFIGFIGLNFNAQGLPFAPCTDIGWRLAVPHWGRGFATEGALASLKFAFEQAGLTKVVSMTPLSNRSSEGVMKKIGMQRESQTFCHPALPLGHSLSEHVLYTMDQMHWEHYLKEQSLGGVNRE